MRKKIGIILAVGLGAAALSFILATWLAPWFYAINTRVRLKMEAPAETEIVICWDEKQAECLPLVPYLEADRRLAKAGEVASVWLGELPPRPAYFVSLVFKSGVNGALFHELDLDSTTSQYGVIAGVGVGAVRITPDQFQIQDVSYQLNNGVTKIVSSEGGILNLNKGIKPLRSEDQNLGLTTLKVWILIFSIFWAFFIPVFWLPKAVANLGSANTSVRQAGYPWWVYLLSCLAAAMMLFVVAHSTVGINPYDPINFLQLADSGRWFSNQRLPGYPLFLGFALWLTSGSLNGVVLVQGLLLVISTFFCVWMLRKWLHPFAAVLFVFLCLLSPAQIRYARWILRESVFASLVLLGITFLIAHYTSRKPVSKIWLIFYAITCMAAFLVRENGILIGIALFPFLAVEAIRYLQTSQKIWERFRAVFFLCVRYSLPIFAIGIVYLGFSSFNYFRSGYFQVVFLQKMYQNLGKTLYTTNFDSRSLLSPATSMSHEGQSYLGWPLYSSYILAREQVPTLDPMFVSFIPVMNRSMTERGLPLNYFRIASILDEIGKSSILLLPWQADLSGLLRQYKAFILVNMANSLVQNDPASLIDKQGWLGQFSGRIKYEEALADPGRMITQYYETTQEYNWFNLIVILALISSFYIFLYEDPVFLAPITIYILNGLFLIVTSFVYHRFVIILDIMLVLQIVLGLSLWINKRDLKKRQLAEKKFNLSV